MAHKKSLPTSEATENAPWFLTIDSEDFGTRSCYCQPKSTLEEVGEERGAAEPALPRAVFLDILSIGSELWTCSTPDQS